MIEKMHTEQIVIGAGALGCAVGWDFSAGRQDLDLPPSARSPLLVVRSLPHAPVQILNSNMNADALSASSVVLPQEWFATAQELAAARPLFCAPVVDIFVCTPPGVACASTLEFLRSVDFSPETNLNVVFCVNGLLEQEPLAALAESHPDLLNRIACFRALFFAGFMRTRTAEGSRVFHTGGTLVKYGTWPDVPEANAPGALSVSGAWKRPGNSIAGLVPPRRAVVLNWQRVPQVATEEFTKFFINMSLAMKIGPTNAPNETLRLKLSAQDALKLAQAFAGLRPRLKLDLSTCLESLWQTVRATARNTNSISLAGSKGNAELFVTFWNMLWALVEDSSDPELQKFWTEQRVQMHQLWGEF